MKKTILSRLFIPLIWLMGASLALGLLITGPSRAGANEVLAKTPSVTEKDGSFNQNILADTAAWFNDRFFGRQELISVNNWLTGKLFGVSAAEDVILGEDGWLYYGSTLADHTGTELLSDGQIGAIANNLALMQESCQAQGKTFGFAVAPNKNSLYPQYMPDYGVTAQERNLQRLQAALAAREVNYIDLLAALQEQPEQLYFAHDSHWNAKGAALGADVINTALGRQSSYFTGDFSQQERHDGDLYAMLYPAFTDPETHGVYGGRLEFTFTGNGTRPDSATILTQGAGEGSLLCYRDSFGNLLFPYLADSFSSCRFSRSTAYDLTLEADFVVIELVERNLSWLLRYQPVFLAPLREISLPQSSGSLAVTVSTPKSPENTQLVKGALPATADAGSPIYLVCADGTYQATHTEKNGFGAYLSADAAVTGVAFYAGGQLQLLDIA